MFKKKKMIVDSDILKFGFLGGILETAYIFMVVLFMTAVTPGLPKDSDSLVAPLLMLMIFVFSAAVSAILVFGYPAYLAAQKKYAESLITVITTLGTMVIIGILLFILISFL